MIKKNKILSNQNIFNIHNMFSSLENIYDTIKKNGLGSINDFINGQNIEIDTELAIDQSFVSVVEKQGLVFATQKERSNIISGCGIGYWAIESDFVVDGNCDGTVNYGI